MNLANSLTLSILVELAHEAESPKIVNDSAFAARATPALFLELRSFETCTSANWYVMP